MNASIQVFKTNPPKPTDLLTVPNAQQPSRQNSEIDKARYREWASKVTSGVTHIITGRRGQAMTKEQKIDLCHCLNLLDSKSELMFDWDISLYTNPPELSAPRVPTAAVGSLTGDKTYRDYENPEEDYDEDEIDPIARPTWNLGEVRIVRLPFAPFWSMAR